MVRNSTDRAEPRRAWPTRDVDTGDVDTGGVDTRDAGDDRWLMVLWPLAVLFHLAANSHHLVRMDRVGSMQLVVAAVAIAAVVRPHRALAAGLAAAHLLMFGAKLPFVGNHEMILAFIDLVVLIAVGSTIRPGRSRSRPWASMAGPGLRLVLIGSYGAIALSKFNRAFFDPEVSCAVVFGGELGRWVGLDPSGHGLLSAAVIGATVAIEGAIPPLLVWRRTRTVGLVLALSFHSILALDPVGHVYDFSSALLPLFLLFLPHAARRELGDRFDRLRRHRSEAEIGLVLTVAAMLHGLVLVTAGPRWAVAYPLWLVIDGSILAWVIRRAGWFGRWAGTGADGRIGVADRHALRALGPMTPVLALVVLVAAAPHVDLRTAASLNMYSNLRVAQGASNHLFVPTAGEGRDRVRIVDVRSVDGNDPDRAQLEVIRIYRDDGRLVPVENLRRHLATHPGIEVDVAGLDGDPSTVTTTLGSGQSWGLWDEALHRVAYRRAVAPAEPAPCARSWGPLG